MTGAVSFAVPVASATLTGVASFGNQFVVSTLGAVSLTSNYVMSVNGSTGAVGSIATTSSNTFSGLQTMSVGLTTNHLYVSQGATFAGSVRIQGITGGLSVTGGATITGGVALFGTVTINGSAYQGGGIGTSENTFTGLQTMNAGLSASHLYVSNGATFNGMVANEMLINNNNVTINMSSNARSWFL